MKVNSAGVVCFGEGEVTIKNSILASNSGIGLQLGVATAHVVGNKIFGGHVGVFILKGRKVKLVSNVIALALYGIILGKHDCPLWGANTFKGTVLGQRNAAFGYKAPLCPAKENKDWPDLFLIGGYQKFMQHLSDQFFIVSTLMERQSYQRADDILKDINFHLQATSFPVPERFEADIHLTVALLKAHVGDAHMAVKEVTQAISFYERLGLWSQEVRTYNTLGILFRRLGKYLSSIEAYSEAIKSLQKVSPSAEAEYLRRITFHNLGVAYAFASFYEEALIYFEKASLPFLSQENAAVVFQLIGDYDMAIQEHSAAIKTLRKPTRYFLQIMEAASSPIILEMDTFVPSDGNGHNGNVFIQLAIAYSNLAITLAEIKLYKKAIDHLEQAIHIFKTYEMADHYIDSYINLGVCYTKMGDIKRAIECYKEALTCLGRLGELDVRRFALIANGFGELYRQQRSFEAAIEWYTKALNTLSSIEMPDLEWRLLFNLGLCFEELGTWEQAMEFYEEAIAEIEVVREHLRTEELKIAWGERTRHVYERLMELLRERGKGASALFYAERCRARTFLDLLAKGPLGTLENVVEAGIKTGVVDPKEVEADAREVIRSLPEGTTAVEYFVGEDATYVWVIQGGKISDPAKLPQGREELLEEIIRMREAMEDPTNSVVNRYLAELYEWLIRPIEGLLPEGGHLVIIPSGPLFYLPFQALIWTREDRSQNAYLIERYSITYAPSLTVLKYARHNRDQAYPEPRFLGLADPDPKDPKIPRLPAARKEVQAAAGVFPEHRVYVDVEATEEVFRAECGSARHILLSTHGFFNPQNPLFSFLVLSPTDGTDGKLYAHEVFGLGLGAELVVLSACETLLPSLREGEKQIRAIRGLKEEEPVKLPPKLLEELTSGDEIMGLTRAFFSAGAASVLSSLWSVPSESTAELVAGFYRGIGAGKDKADALREAQLGVLRKEGWQHPYFWAAFCLNGDWSPSPSPIGPMGPIY